MNDLTFSSLGCPQFSLEQVVALALRHHVKELELRFINNSVDLPCEFEKHYESPQLLKAFLGEQGVSIRVLGTSFCLIGNSSEMREAFLQFIPWAEFLEVPYLRVFDGGEKGTALTTDDLLNAVDTVMWWRELKRELALSVDIIVETHSGLLTSDLCLKLNQLLPSPVVILWDVYHTYYEGGEEPFYTWSTLKNFIAHIHLKDGCPKFEPKFSPNYCVPGAGQMPLVSLVNRIRRDGFSGLISLEWEKAWFKDLPKLEDALEEYVNVLGV